MKTVMTKLSMSELVSCFNKKDEKDYAGNCFHNVYVYERFSFGTGEN
jgi:hypothetical protein